jgi:hypothetical protein
MRTTDEEPQPMRPLGERVTPPKPTEPEWKPYVDRNGTRPQGVEVNSEGKIRTNRPLPTYPRWFP